MPHYAERRSLSDRKCCNGGYEWVDTNNMSERLALLGIMGDQLKALEPSPYITVLWYRRFKEPLNSVPILLRGVGISCLIFEADSNRIRHLSSVFFVFTTSVLYRVTLHPTHWPHKELHVFACVDFSPQDSSPWKNMLVSVRLGRIMLYYGRLVKIS